MCGRYESWVDDDEVTAVLEMEKQGSAARYLRQTEVFPGTVQPVLYGSRIRMRAHLSKWGLTVQAADSGDRDPDGGGNAGDEISAPDTTNAGRGRAPRSFINARSETAAEKKRFSPAFRDPERNGDGSGGRGRAGQASDVRRVIVPTSGYFEWNGGIKYRIFDRDGGLLFLAALEEDDGELLRENAPDPSKVFSVFSSAAWTCPEDGGVPGGTVPPSRGLHRTDPGRRHVILTAEAAVEPARIHTRMPLFLRREEIEAWLYDREFARMRLRRPWSGNLEIRAAQA